MKDAQNQETPRVLKFVKDTEGETTDGRERSRDRYQTLDLTEDPAQPSEKPDKPIPRKLHFVKDGPPRALLKLEHAQAIGDEAGRDGERRLHFVKDRRPGLDRGR